jgi:hypothetical protein
MSKESQLALTSHVGRDLLSSASAFKTEASVVWEYVVNSLQYVDPGISPRVQVNVDPRRRTIQVHDNGQGMDRQRLEHFFMMHGENIERVKGRPGRGKFGTGKAAAFGIGNNLRIETCRNGVRNVVELSRKDVEQSDGGNIPITALAIDEPIDSPNNTVVTISEIFLNKIRMPSIVEYIERHLQVFRSVAPVVAVNDHVCEYKEPETTSKHPFYPSDEQRKVLGDVELIVRVSKMPLDEFDRGIRVSAGPGNLVGIEDCGITRKEHGSYLFGEIDVPAIDRFSSRIEPYDDSRSLRLNPEHPVVRVLIGFVGSSLEKVRKNLVDSYKEARLSEQARRLAAEANKISDVLNEDFRRVRDRLKEIRSAVSQAGPATSLFGSADGAAEEDSAWTQGIAEPGDVETPDPSSPDRPADSRNRPDPEVRKSGSPNPAGRDSVSPAGGAGKRRKPKGGFSVDYEHLGPDEARSVYDDAALRIVINLDHPVVAKALATSGPEDLAFRRLSYEIAFSEYAMALGYEMAGQDPDIPADDLLYEVRSTLNRVSSAAAALYQ